MIEYGHGTHVGLRRTRNEDTYYADASLGLFLVADGMGGHQHGEVASALVREAMVELISQGRAWSRRSTALPRDYWRTRATNDDLLPMGTTIAALQTTAAGYEVAWVGDSRIYLWQRELRQISHDHSLVQALVEAGQLDPAQAPKHPQRNVLTQALGITPMEQLHIGMARGQLAPGMGFVLCSDGLTDAVDDKRHCPHSCANRSGCPGVRRSARPERAGWWR